MLILIGIIPGAYALNLDTTAPITDCRDANRAAQMTRFPPGTATGGGSAPRPPTTSSAFPQDHGQGDSRTYAALAGP